VSNSSLFAVIAVTGYAKQEEIAGFFEIKDSFRNFERMISGSPTRVASDEKNELSRIMRGFQVEPEQP